MKDTAVNITAHIQRKKHDFPNALFGIPWYKLQLAGLVDRDVTSGSGMTLIIIHTMCILVLYTRFTTPTGHVHHHLLLGVRLFERG